MIIATHISHITDVMAVAFCSIMVNDSIQFIRPNHILRVALQLYLLLNLNSIIYFLIVHLPLTEHESFQMHDQNLGQRTDLSLL